MGKSTIISLVFVCFACILSAETAEYELLEDTVNLVRVQIELEMKASLFYQTYSHYFESSDQALHGFSHFFSDQSLEEKMHADKLMTYLNKRNVPIKTLTKIRNICQNFTDQSLCKYITANGDYNKFDTLALTAIENALEFEILVYNSLVAIVKAATDPQLKHFIEHEYLDEQVESIKELRDYKTQLKNIDIDKVGLLLFDRWLMDRKSS